MKFTKISETSIKRTSDNEVFSVNDRIVSKGYKYGEVIYEFIFPKSIDDEVIAVTGEGGRHINQLLKFTGDLPWVTLDELSIKRLSDNKIIKVGELFENKEVVSFDNDELGLLVITTEGAFSIN